MTGTTASRTGRGLLDRRLLVLALGLGLIVAATAYVCIEFPRSQGRIAPIWLANAWVAPALIRSRVRHWPLLGGLAGIGLAVANLAVGMTAWPAFGLAACNLGECLTAAAIIRHFCGPDFDISRVSHLLTFVAASVAGALLSACGGAYLFGYVDHDSVVRGILVWTAADVLGMVTLAPALLVLTQKSRARFEWREAWTLAVFAAVAFLVLFVLHYPLLFVISAVLTLPTWRMGLPGAVGGFAILTTIGTAALLTQTGPLMVGGPSDRIIGLQIFLAASFLTSVPVAVARDASEQLKARLRGALDEARAARAEAEAAAAVKTEFLANMSHELRTPLTSVVGFTRLAAEQRDLTPVTRDYIDRVSQASRALLCAVNDILDFSKLEAGQVTFKPEPMSVASLLRSVLHMFAPQAAEKDLTLRLEDDTPTGLTVTLDPDRLRQVLLNLVGNAVKFTARGEVTLAARYDHQAQRLIVTIADTGIGISAEGLDLLFKRFSQVNGSLTRGHGGTGLGLAICKGIVEALGGRIGATSVVGQGSRFTFTIPAPRAENLAETAASSADEPIARTGARVMVADDHPANRELVKLFLAAIGATVSEAADGEAAVALAAAEPFDVILMDLRMPRMDGLGAVEAIRAAQGPNRTTPILAFTADAESAFDGRLENVGFDGAVAKPVEPGQLIAAISAAMADAEALNEPDAADHSGTAAARS